ncbi:MAG: hypothetical protein AAF479_15770 [Pseudomonadota bacterium]
MKRFVLFFVLSLGAALAFKSAKADSIIVEYFTTLSVKDTYNSRGKPLNSVCAIVQQDRANVHKFGNPDGEQPDAFFTTAARRAMISGKCAYDRTHHTVDRIRSQFIGFVLVRVFGSGARVTRVEISEAAG